jgi:Zn-dependent membrane protease YugP
VTDWWWLCLLVYVPVLANRLAVLLYGYGTHRLDKANEDDLPLTAGEWLDREIERCGLADKIRAIVTDESAVFSTDAYHVRHGVIQLSADTYFKRDGVQWATAAHELGHARFRLGWPILGRVILLACPASRVLFAVGAALCFGNVLYARPEATALAFVLFAVAAALQIFELVDEAVASVLGLRMLRATRELYDHHRPAARRAVLLAFLTYFVTAVARALLLTQWSIVRRLTSVPHVPPLGKLTDLGELAALVLTIVLWMYALTCLVAIARKRRMPPLFAFVKLVSLAAFLWLAWNHAATARYEWCAMLAFVELTGLLLGVLSLPMWIVDSFVLRRLTKRLPLGTVTTIQLNEARLRGRSQRIDGNAHLATLLKAGDPRLAVLVQLTYLPLLLAFWRFI